MWVAIHAGLESQTINQLFSNKVRLDPYIARRTISLRAQEYISNCIKSLQQMDKPNYDVDGRRVPYNYMLINLANSIPNTKNRKESRKFVAENFLVIYRLDKEIGISCPLCTLNSDEIFESVFRKKEETKVATSNKEYEFNLPPVSNQIQEHHKLEQSTERYEKFSKLVLFLDEVRGLEKCFNLPHAENIDRYNVRDLYNQVLGFDRSDSYGYIIQIVNRIPKKEVSDKWKELPNPKPEKGIILTDYSRSMFDFVTESRFILFPTITPKKLRKTGIRNVRSWLKDPG